MVGAERLGERLLGEVEGEGLNELLNSLRELTSSRTQRVVLGIPELDALLPAAASPVSHHGQHHQQQHHVQPQPQEQNLNHPSSHFWASPSDKLEKKATPPPIIEFISPPTTHHPSGAGKTSLLYLITTLAILPPSLSSTALQGHNATILILDPLSHFSIPRLAQVMLAHLLSQFTEHGRGDIEHDETLWKEVRETVTRSLSHVHIFRPQSWDSLIATLQEMPEYLFASGTHKSMGRRVHALVLEDVDAFYWGLRAGASMATATATNANTNANPLLKPSTSLTSALLPLLSLLTCPAILTSHSLLTSSPNTQFRAPIPTTWPSSANLNITRFAFRRVEVTKFAPGISIQEAERERGQRWEVVRRGRFECWRVGGGGGGGVIGGGEEGFVFRVGEGVFVERG
ncbi:hypothetical protein P154DRAFT_563818 [Amniculicola lignicola CBS 123094]|uniref:DNA recombination and repair protein Rad51-like C-terminal domain-containing protein n=1 Tax=Amniculicola lignicola CBS 123094 TaxID=1392246 RepID=A0A6A5WG35_9PLEO|nr:hypothetical protein P154DRAFT_563818 [Amniculicola lignicola CBS 123094]